MDTVKPTRVFGPAVLDSQRMRFTQALEDLGQTLATVGLEVQSIAICAKGESRADRQDTALRIATPDIAASLAVPPGHVIASYDPAQHAVVEVHDLKALLKWATRAMGGQAAAEERSQSVDRIRTLIEGAAGAG